MSSLAISIVSSHEPITLLSAEFEHFAFCEIECLCQRLTWHAARAETPTANCCLWNIQALRGTLDAQRFDRMHHGAIRARHELAFEQRANLRVRKLVEQQVANIPSLDDVDHKLRNVHRVVPDPLNRLGVKR